MRAYRTHGPGGGTPSFRPGGEVGELGEHDLRERSRLIHEALTIIFLKSLTYQRHEPKWEMIVPLLESMSCVADHMVCAQLQANMHDDPT